MLEKMLRFCVTTEKHVVLSHEGLASEAVECSLD